MDVPPGVQRDYPLSTIRAGFARAAGADGLEPWAGVERVEVGVAGSGSNPLIADVGVRGLVLKLDKELSEIELDGTRTRCGGGARLPAVCVRAARAGLAGSGFGAGIPGTVGSERR
jgi:UDP-N-acetylenolpyruvoylglucosamine reductase